MRSDLLFGNRPRYVSVLSPNTTGAEAEDDRPVIRPPIRSVTRSGGLKWVAGPGRPGQ